MCVSVSICVSSHIFFSSFVFALSYAGLFILFCIILLLDASLFSNEGKKRSGFRGWGSEVL